MRKVLQQLKQYKRNTFLCIGFTALEVIMEILMPFITAIIIDRGLRQAIFRWFTATVPLMVVMAFLSLAFGALAGKTPRRFVRTGGQSEGGHLRHYPDIFFSNIDKFSVPGLVTRMTTDITNVQNAFMMIIRVAVRAPLNLIFSFAMCLVISPRLSSMYPDRRGISGGCDRLHHGGYSENLQTGVPQVR